MLVCLLLMIAQTISAQHRKTVLTVKGEDFYINGKPTYPGITWKGIVANGTSVAAVVAVCVFVVELKIKF